MKKLLYVCGLAAALAACSNSGTKHGPSGTAVTSTTVRDQTVPSGPPTTVNNGAGKVPPPVLHSVGDSFTAGAVTVKLLGFLTTVPSPADNPPAGTTFADAQVESCAGSTAAQTVGPADFVLDLDGGGQASPHRAEQQPAFLLRNLKAGECERGHVTFLVPNGQKPTVLAVVSTQQGWRL